MSEIDELRAAASDFLAATDALCDWLDARDIGADHHESRPDDYEWLCASMTKLRAILDEPAALSGPPHG